MRTSISNRFDACAHPGGTRKLSVSFVLLREGLAGTVIDAPGFAAIGIEPLAASNQADVPPPTRRTRMRPRTPGSVLPPKPSKPCRTITRTIVGLPATRRTECVSVWMLCVTSTDWIQIDGRLLTTTLTSRNTEPQGPVAVRR